MAAEEMHPDQLTVSPRTVGKRTAAEQFLPGAGYPLPWTVFSWRRGDPADAVSCSQSESLAADLGEVILAVRVIDTQGRIYDRIGRGGELGSYGEWIELCLANSKDIRDVASLRAIWDQVRVLLRGDTPDVMNHGDLVLPNVSTASGHLAGVLDVSGSKAAVPALAFVCAWHLRDTPRRELPRNHTSGVTATDGAADADSHSSRPSALAGTASTATRHEHQLTAHPRTDPSRH
ncbi:phosphotransferase [Mycobacterium kyogaense]|uniref:phosphotransferase n=1 Tax=Mycobacterium kyogaense TaxID=2212479 RepID=UPI000DAC56CE|nr:phosphotransferase [Mycobacterium kyogaense]